MAVSRPTAVTDAGLKNWRGSGTSKSFPWSRLASRTRKLARPATGAAGAEVIRYSCADRRNPGDGEIEIGAIVQ